MNFQKVVLIISAIILIIVLLFIGYSLSQSKSDIQWPPMIGDCPDFWVDLSGNGEACFNSHSLGKCNIPTADEQGTKNFNTYPYNAENGTCAKYTWAKGCGVSWDGITYGFSTYPCASVTGTT